MIKKLLIFGTSGFVGPYLAREFHNYDYEIMGCDLNESSSLPEYVHFFHCDILNGLEVTNLINKVQPSHIVNLAAISSVGQSWKMPQMPMQVNVIGALNILEAARSVTPLPKVMFIGSSEQYAPSDKPINEQSLLDANSPYGISKMTQEQIARLYHNQYGMKAYCVRPFNHTGIGQKETFVLPSWCKQVAEISCSGQPGSLTAGNLDVKRDFSHVKDIVRAYRMIFENNDSETIYNVGSGNAYLLKDLLEYIISLSSQPVSIKIDAKLIRPVDTFEICCDHSSITAKLGWSPTFTVFDAIKEMVDEFLQNCGTFMPGGSQ